MDDNLEAMKQEILRLLPRINDTALIRRVWKLLLHALSGPAR